MNIKFNIDIIFRLKRYFELFIRVNKIHIKYYILNELSVMKSFKKS